MGRIELPTSPLPRECSTTEPHGRRARRSAPCLIPGAGEGNRTLVLSLEGFSSTIELHPPAGGRGPAPRTAPRPPSPAPIAGIPARLVRRPSNLIAIARARAFPPARSPFIARLRALTENLGGGGWIRTNVGVKPTDLQSAPFSRSGTPPGEEPQIVAGCQEVVKPSADA